MNQVVLQILIEGTATFFATAILTVLGYGLLAWRRAKGFSKAAYAIIARMESVLKPTDANSYSTDLDDLDSLVDFFEDEAIRIDHGFMRPNLETRLRLRNLREQVKTWKGKFANPGDTNSIIRAIGEDMQTRQGRKTESDRFAQSLKAFADDLSIWSFFRA